MWLLTSLLCLSLLLAHGYQKEIIGIMGENFTFPVQIDQKIVEIVWKKNKHKVAEWEDENKTTYYGSRSVLMKNGSLTIVNLEKDDAGTYELVYWNSVEEHSLNFELVVLGVEHGNSLIFLLIVPIVLTVVILGFLWWKGIIKPGRRTAKNNSPVNGSGKHEQLNPCNSQQQSNSERDRALDGNEEGLKDKLIVENGVNQEDRALDGNEEGLKDKLIVENGVNQEEVPQDAEGENGGHPDNSSSCTKGDLEA
ncbi:uncharacterized protein LOC134414176 isoform X2 [Melospiza melodia melodia]|uniref:uncharacterized protein LOC134414176 isoform X2 n=1 Tax=Melospiza melodia melodia TaxID=1914991 RepID=UPI002FD13C47